MQLLPIAFLIAGFSNVVLAHYRFAWLTANGIMGAEYQWIRKNTNYNSPVTDVTSTDIRCNVGANGTGTDTTTVAAGSTVKFTLDIPVYHQGPVAWYLGTAPGTASDWDGSGANWFKIAQEGPDFSTGSGGSATWPMFQEYNTTIPTSIPPGDYLLRIEQIGLHNPGGLPQFFISCAQITVTGGGSVSPSKVSIPGYVSATDPGLTVNIWEPSFTTYTFPGPTVFSG